MCLFISKWPFGKRKRCWIQVGPSTPQKYQIIFGTFWTNDRNPITNGLLVKLAYSVCWETCEIFCVFFRVPPQKKNNPKMRPSGRHQAPPAAKIHPMGAPPCHLPLPAPSLPPRPSCRNWMRQYAERVTMTIPFLPWTWKRKVALVER